MWRTSLEILDDLGLATLMKTTGGKGIHLVVPIVRHVSAERLRAAATRLAEIAVERNPDSHVRVPKGPSGAGA